MDQDHEQSHASSPSTNVARHRDTVDPGHSSRSALLRKPDHAVASGLVQRKARDANGVADGAEHAVAAAASSSGAPLPATLMRKFEGSLGADLSGVRTHTGDASARAADAVGAKAYTTGNDIHFGAGHYDPASSGGQHLLAHEVAHTVQQSGGAQQMQRKPEVSSPGDGLEREADRAADAMVSGGPATVSRASGGGHHALQRKVASSSNESGDGDKSNLKLSKNRERYRQALERAKERTGVDAATIAAMIDAESKGEWNPDKPNGNALGLAQFKPDAWKELALYSGSQLHRHALEKKFIQRAKGKNGRMVITNEQALLGLRRNPELSMVSLVEHGKMNLAAMEKAKLVPETSSDEGASYMYVAHHDGAAGAIYHYTDSIDCTEHQAESALNALKTLGIKVTRGKKELAKSAYRRYMESRESATHKKLSDQFKDKKGKVSGKSKAKIAKLYGEHGSWERAYRAWLSGYVNERVNPDQFRN